MEAGKMEVSIKNITENYRDRMERLVLLDPLYELSRKTARDKSGNIIDYYGLGLLTLLFFFENMLIRNKKAGAVELAEFLIKLTDKKLDLDYETCIKLSREIIQAFRPASGKRNSREFFNWETNREEIIEYSILKAADFDAKSNLQYYELDEDGLELIFATKEFFSEFQLSINQLILRKQLEKGEFVGALRQIDEMRMDVRNIQEKIYRIKHEIQRNIISNETYERYESIVDDIHFRLNRENEEFQELKTFINETKNRLEYETHKDKMDKAYGLILKIDRELGQVHYEHRNLLLESMEMKTRALNAAQESLYYVGIDSFNFKKQITSKLISTPLPLESARNLVAPFLYLGKGKFWSPLAVFAKQGIIRKDMEAKSKAFLDPMEEEEIQKDIGIQQENYGYIMEKILLLMGDNNSITLEKVVEHLSSDEDVDILNKRSFYDFWLNLHFNSPIKIHGEENPSLLLEKAIKLLGRKYTKLEVVELNESIQASPRYTVKNMKLILEVDEGAI